jgi:hypothetical protein
MNIGIIPEKNGGDIFFEQRRRALNSAGSAATMEQEFQNTFLLFVLFEQVYKVRPGMSKARKAELAAPKSGR